MSTSDITAAAHPQDAAARAASVVGAPVAWLGVAVAGILLVCLGVVIDVYRHDHGADAAELISFSNPGTLVAIAGGVLVTGGVLTALSMLVLRDQNSVDTVVTRGAILAGVWTVVVASAVGAVTYAAAAGVTIGHAGHDASATSPSGDATSEPPGIGDRATLRGTLTLDGEPLETEFLGVRTVRDGLTTACQATIPAVTQGAYEIDIAADAEVRGCGVDDAQLLLWAFVDDQYVYATTTTEWPGDGDSATFDAAFSSSDPEGASKPGMGLKGELFDSDGTRLPAGTVVEAYVDDTLCGVTSLRYGDTTENLYTLYVAGPDSVDGCDEGATLTFTLNGDPAAETTTNNPNREEDGSELNLTLE